MSVPRQGRRIKKIGIIHLRPQYSSSGLAPDLVSLQFFTQNSLSFSLSLRSTSTPTLLPSSTGYLYTVNPSLFIFFLILFGISTLGFRTYPCTLTRTRAEQTEGPGHLSLGLCSSCRRKALSGRQVYVREVCSDTAIKICLKNTLSIVAPWLESRRRGQKQEQPEDFLLSTTSFFFPLAICTGSPSRRDAIFVGKAYVFAVIIKRPNCYCQNKANDL